MTRCSFQGQALTKRELEALSLLAKGLKTSEAAKLMGISIHTLRDHLANINRKLYVSNRAEATAWFVRREYEAQLTEAKRQVTELQARLTKLSRAASDFVDITPHTITNGGRWFSSKVELVRCLSLTPT